MPKLHCLIYERDAEGHRLHHVRHLAESLVTIGCDVTLALQEHVRSRPEYQVHLQSLEPHFRLEERPATRGAGTSAAWARVDDLLDTVAAVRPDWAYITFADSLTQTAALRGLLYGAGAFRQTPIEGHINRVTFAYPAESLAERVKFESSGQLLLRSPWIVTHILDPFAFEAIERRHPPARFRLIPEPVEALPAIGRDEARDALGIPRDGRYVSMVGGMGPRKGIEPLLAAFARAKLAEDDRVLLVGKMAKPIRQLIDEQYDALVRRGRLVFVDRYVSDFELACGFIAADVVAVTHPRNIGSSGTLVRAVAANRPLLTANYGWGGWVTKTFSLGRLADVWNIDALVGDLEASFRECHAYRRTEGAERFCRYHTLENQKAHWVEEIGRVHNLPLGSLANRIEWGWVLEGRSDDERQASAPSPRSLRNLIRHIPGAQATYIPIARGLRSVRRRVFGLHRGERYNVETEEVMRRVLRPVSVCVDLGANVGDILKWMVQLAPAGRHYAVEALPQFAARLAKQFPGVQVFPCAVGDATGEFSFNYLPDRPAYSGLRRRQYPREDLEIQVITVPVRRLDDLIEPGVKVDFLKADIEGGEYNAFLGGRRVISESKPHIVFEFGKGGAGFYDITPEMMYALLHDEFGLHVSTMQRWLNSQPPLALPEFRDAFHKDIDVYFIAYP